MNIVDKYFHTVFCQLKLYFDVTSFQRKNGRDRTLLHRTHKIFYMLQDTECTAWLLATVLQHWSYPYPLELTFIHISDLHQIFNFLSWKCNSSNNVNKCSIYKLSQGKHFCSQASPIVNNIFYRKIALLFAIVSSTLCYWSFYSCISRITLWFVALLVIMWSHYFCFSLCAHNPGPPGYR